MKSQVSIYLNGARFLAFCTDLLGMSAMAAGLSNGYGIEGIMQMLQERTSAFMKVGKRQDFAQNDTPNCLLFFLQYLGRCRFQTTVFAILLRQERSP